MRAVSVIPSMPHAVSSRRHKAILSIATPPWGRNAALALTALLALLLAACATPSGLVTDPAPPRSGFVDDGDAESLERALEQSLRYFRGLPPDTPFQVGPHSYSAEEMAQSLLLFRHLRRTAPDAAAFRKRLRERFHIVESVAPRGENLFTGYYEPEIPGSPTPTEHLNTPLYTRPTDLVEVDLSSFGSNLPDKRLIGRIEGDRLVPYPSREEIQEEDALQDVATPIAYVNRLDLFFLQIQGSGVVVFPDGSRLMVGYEGSNGHPYRSIGAELVRRDALTREEVSMQSIRDYLRTHPEAVDPLLYSNPSYVFFGPRDEGPLGNIRVPLTPRRSIAADRRLLPKGALAYVVVEVPVPDDPETTRTMRRFMLVQDTGGAIRGHGRADIFWGGGDEAEWIAGHQKHGGRLFLLAAKKDFLPPPPEALESPPSVAEHQDEPQTPDPAVQ